MYAIATLTYKRQGKLTQSIESRGVGLRVTKILAGIAMGSEDRKSTTRQDLIGIQEFTTSFIYSLSKELLS